MYPSRPRELNHNNLSTIKAPEAPTTAPPQAPATVGPQGGAPSLQPWSGTPSTTNVAPLLASPWGLREIADQYKPVVDRVKGSLQAAFSSLSEDQRSSAFWSGYQQYPEQMAQMIVRRVLTNRMANQVTQGPIAEWMSWLDQRGGR